MDERVKEELKNGLNSIRKLKSQQRDIYSQIKHNEMELVRKIAKNELWHCLKPDYTALGYTL